MTTNTCTILSADAHITHSRPETLLAFFYLIDYCEQNGIKHLIVAGDLWETRKNVPVREQDEVAQWFITTADHAGITIYLVPGNHDFESDTEAARHSLGVFAPYPNVVVAQRPYTMVQLEGSPYTMVLMPFEPNSDTLRKTLKDLAASTSPPAQSMIIVGHQCIKGTNLNGHKITSSVLGNWYKPFFRTFMGDIHDRQKIGPVQYIGATIQHNFGDVGKDRGFLEFDPVAGREKFFSIPNAPRYTELATTAAHILGDQPGFTASILSQAAAGDYVKLVIEGERSELAALELGKLRRELMEKHHLRVVLETRATAITPQRLEIEPAKLSDVNAVAAAYVAQAETALDRDWLLKIGNHLLQQCQQTAEVGDLRQIVPVDLTLYNFGSFEYAKFVVENGVTSVLGLNLDEGGSNASGKSNLLNAWQVLFFGDTEQKIAADDLVRWYQDDPYTLIGNFTDNLGNTIQIKRSKARDQAATASYSENGVELENKVPAVNQRILRLLNMDRELFKFLVFMTQEGRHSFADVGDADRRKVLAKILPSIPTLDEALAVTKQAVKEGETGLHDIANDLLKQQSAMETLKQQDYQHVCQQFEQEQATAIQTAEASLQVAVGTLNAANDALQQFTPQPLRDYAEELAAHEAVLTQRAQVLLDRDLWLQERSKLVAQREGKLADITNAIHSIGNMRANQTGVCDKCLQPLTPEAVASFMTQKESDVLSLRSEVAQLDSNLQAANSALVQYNHALNEFSGVEATIARINVEMQKQQQVSFANAQQEQQLHYAIRDAQLSVQQRQQEVANAKTLENPYTTIIAKQQEEIQHRQEAIDDLQTRHAQAETTLSGLRFWIEGFGPKGMRIFMFDTFVSSLSQHINGFIETLLEGVFITLETTRQTGTGDVREELNFRIWKDGIPRPIERFSGGEQRLMKLAVNLSVAFAAQEYLRTSFGFLVMDESFNNLDGVRVQKVASALTSLTKKVPAIYIVSHMDALQDQLTQSVVVRKQHGISTLTYEKREHDATGQ